MCICRSASIQSPFCVGRVSPSAAISRKPVGVRELKIGTNVVHTTVQRCFQQFSENRFFGPLGIQKRRNLKPRKNSG